MISVTAMNNTKQRHHGHVARAKKKALDPMLTGYGREPFPTTQKNAAR